MCRQLNLMAQWCTVEESWDSPGPEIRRREIKEQGTQPGSLWPLIVEHVWMRQVQTKVTAGERLCSVE